MKKLTKTEQKKLSNLIDRLIAEYSDNSTNWDVEVVMYNYDDEIIDLEVKCICVNPTEEDIEDGFEAGDDYTEYEKVWRKTFDLM